MIKGANLLFTQIQVIGNCFKPKHYKTTSSSRYETTGSSIDIHVN